MIGVGEGENKNKKRIILIALVIIAIIVLWILIPNIPKLMQQEKNENEEKPIYQQYEKFEGKDTIVYRNDELNVSITREYDDYWDYTVYEAEWNDIKGNPGSISASTPENLYDEILEEAEDLSSNQLKWFEYMCKNTL